jgi:SAM-dependent methyltransferase
MKQQAAETMSVQQATDRLAVSEEWLHKVLYRLEPLLQQQGLPHILDVGAAQGRTLIALGRLGYEAQGVEPWDAAIEVAEQLAASEGVSISIRKGSAESIPFDDASFDLVLAFSVMEHVTDLERSLREINRTLRPGGIFWFYSASARCPRQAEISRFPLFGWYPDALKRRIMLWARDRRPALVGYTDTPALHWWTPAKARRLLREAGFVEIWDRWDLIAPDELTGPKGRLASLAKRNRAVRLLADVVEEGCAYAARKSLLSDAESVSS